MIERTVERELIPMAAELGVSSSQVAIAGTLLNPAVTSTTIGARTLAQAEGNLGALGVDLSDEQVPRPDAVSRPEPILPGRFIGSDMVQGLMFGGARVERRGLVAPCCGGAVVRDSPPPLGALMGERSGAMLGPCRWPRQR